MVDIVFKNKICGTVKLSKKEILILNSLNRLPHKGSEIWNAKSEHTPKKNHILAAHHNLRRIKRINIATHVPSVVRQTDVIKIKGKIKEYLEKTQKKHCIFCGWDLDSRTGEEGNQLRHLEHVAHKEKYPNFCFELENLVLSCARCNISYKKTYDTVNKSGYSPNYRNCSFKIVHPYHDNWRSHISIQENGVLRPLSSKGRITIRLFGLNENKEVSERISHARMRSYEIENKYLKAKIAALQKNYSV